MKVEAYIKQNASIGTVIITHKENVWFVKHWRLTLFCRRGGIFIKITKITLYYPTQGMYILKGACMDDKCYHTKKLNDIETVYLS